MSQQFIDALFGNFIIVIYFISLLFALRYYKKYFDTVLKFFPILIAYTFFNELLGYLIRYSESFAFIEEKTFANDIIYNVYDLFYYGFFYWVYWELTASPKRKRTIKFISFLVFGGYIVSCFFQNPFTISLYYATSFASWALALFIIMYWRSKLPNLTMEKEKKNLMFWVSIGLLFFHIIFPIIFMTGYLKVEIWYEYNFQNILRLIIVLMHVLFWIGFTKSHRRAFG